MADNFLESHAHKTSPQEQMVDVVSFTRTIHVIVTKRKILTCKMKKTRSLEPKSGLTVYDAMVEEILIDKVPLIFSNKIDFVLM